MSGKKRKRRRKMGRWALGIGCMLLSAGAFAAVIYFSHAGQQKKEEVEQKTDEQSKSEEDRAAEEEERVIEAKIDELTLEEKIAQMFLITPDALTGVQGTWNPGTVTEEAFKERPVCGLVMEAENLQSPEQIRNWNDTVTGFSKLNVGVAPFLAVEEEGGSHSEIAGKAAFDVPDVENLSEIGEAEEAYNAGETIGSYLSDLGFTMNLAPAADMGTDQENTEEKEELSETEAEKVAKLVEEAVKGLQSQGIATVVKYFPGQGKAQGETMIVSGTKKELEACEFLPFQAAIDAGTECVMVGHCVLPDLLEEEIPASLSKEVVTEILRGDLGFEGIVMTDAMNQDSITESYTSSEAAVQAVEAGVDLLLMPADFEDAYQGILAAVKSGTISEKRIDESVKRILKVKLEETREDAS